MRVLHVIPSVAPVRGGPSKAVVAMVKALRLSGVDAEIVTTNDNGLDLLDVPLGHRTDYPLPGLEENTSVPVWFFPRFNPSINAVKEFAFSAALTKWLWQNIRNYDLLHVHAIFSYASTAAMAIARLRGVGYIVRPLGQLCEWSLQQSAYKKQIYLKLIEQGNINHSLGLHVTSVQEQQEVSRLGLVAPSFVLPHGLDVSSPIPDARIKLRQLLNLPVDEPIILFLSRLHPKKGLDYLIPALSKLTHHRFTFILAGSGSKEYEAEVESLIVSNGIRDRTYIAGFAAGERKNLFLQGSDLFALTSHSENFGVAVLEAMACGLPVLLTPGVALATIVKEYQLGYIAELNVAAITQAVDSYLNHPQKAWYMGKSARQLVLQKYTWEQTAAQMQLVYTNILQQKLISTCPKERLSANQ